MKNDRMRSSNRGARRWVLPLAAPTLGVLAAATAAWACTGTVNVPTVIKQVNGLPVSQTNPKGGPPGTEFKAKTAQSTAIPKGRLFDLLFVDDAQRDGGVTACHHSPANPLGQKTSVAGTQAGMAFVPKTSGTIPALTQPGEAMVCFGLAPRSNYMTLNTLPDFFVVT